MTLTILFSRKNARTSIRPHGRNGTEGPGVPRVRPYLDRVYFNVWDVDDPFDRIMVGMPDVELIDNDTVGPDNRPVGEPPHLYSALTGEDGEDGEARVTITVSMQPGNNYRAAATCVGDVFAATLPDTPQAEQSDADEIAQSYTGNYSGYQVPAFWSPMLTVWRKLWVERDTMRAPGLIEITVTGTAGAVTTNAPVTGQSTVDLAQNLADEFSDLNLYEEGTIRFFSCPSGADTFGVVESTSETFGSDSVVVLGSPGPCAAGSAYLLRDDDDPSVIPHYPDGGALLVNAFADAYILPVYAGAAYQDVVDFEMHLSDAEVLSGEGSWNDSHDLTSTPDFWSCFVLGAWESNQNDDGDPDLCFSLAAPYSARPGFEGVQTGVTRNEYGQVVIFMQNLADDVACMQVSDEAHTLAHELGHSCGSHNGHVPSSIMQEGAPKGEDRYGAQSIVVFRRESVW